VVGKRIIGMMADGRRRIIGTRAGMTVTSESFAGSMPRRAGARAATTARTSM
jgi:hypothetical protein